MTTTDKRSPFAELLRIVFDEANLWKRDEWAYILTVSPTVIEGWIQDRGIPTPEQLRSIWRLTNELDNVPEWVKERWKDEEHRPFRGMSLVGNKTMRQYMAIPILEGFMRTLECLPGDKQEEILYDAAEKARQALRK